VAAAIQAGVHERPHSGLGRDLEQLAEVRNLWQFYRDRRPDAYGPLVQP
jgi:hypothetical protein